MKKILNLLRRLIVPDTVLQALKSTRKLSRCFAFLYLAAQPVGFVLALWAFWWEPRGIHLVEYHFKTPPGMDGWRGKSIAVITDLHAGSPYITEEKIGRIVAMTNAARPDIVVMTGDFVIQRVLGGTYMPPAVIAGHLKNLKAPLGVFSVMGNHDNWDDDDVARDFIAGGLTVLDDESVELAGSLWLAGFSDLWTGKLRYKEAVRNIPAGAFALCMTHEPDSMPQLPEACRLTMAGHMHGGQVRFPLIGAPVTPSKYGSKYLKGFVTEGGRTVFVSSGIGTTGLGVRFGVPPEISLVRLD